MRRKTVGWLTLSCVFLLLFFCLPISADETEALSYDFQTMPQGYGEMAEALPEELQDSLSDELFSQDAEVAGTALGELLQPNNLFATLSEQLSLGIREAVWLLARLCGLLLLAAVLTRLQESIGSDALSGAVRFCTTTAIFSAIIALQWEHLQAVGVFFERLISLMSATIPVMGALWAMGGNVATAAAGTGTLYVFLTFCENLCAKTILPIVCFCTALALCNTLSGDSGLKGIASSVKKIYTFTLGLLMTLLLSCLSSQTTLSAAADTTAARTAKLVSSTVIPIVGGSVGETLRTVGAGVQYLKSVAGIGGIVLLGYLVLPTLISLIFTRLAFLLSVGIADLLGCDRESRLLSELGSIYGCILAVVAMSSVMFVLAMVIFIKTVVAVG